MIAQTVKTMKTAKSKSTVLIVDGHPVVRAGFSNLIAKESDLRVCGEAESFSEAMCQLRDNPAEIVVTDVSLKNGSGLELTRELAVQSPQTHVLVCSMYDDALYAERALRAGARGYINKREPADRLLAAIRRILEGRVFLSELMTERMLNRSIGHRETKTHSPVESLSDRELEVFEKIGRGVTTRQIAEHLHLSPKTIETYRENIKTKLSLSNATELTQQAVRWVFQNN